MPTISFSGLSSGIDTSGWVDALVSVKQQTVTSLQEQQEAQEALLNVVNEIKSYFSSFQSCLEKLTDSQFGIPSMDLFMQNLAVSSNTNIATATATTEAARQSYDVAVDSLATATKATSGYTQYETKYATLDTQIGLLGAKNGTITVNQQSFSVTTEDTIRSLIQKFQNVGVSAAFDGQKGTFTVGVSLSEIDEGATNIKSALKLQDSTVSGAISGSLVYADRDTEFSKLGLTDGKVIIEGVEHTITQNGNSYTITKAGGTAANLNTVGDFLDYLMSSAVGAESADVDDMGNISIKGATLDSVTGGSNIIDILNLSETFNRTAMESNRLTYIDVHVADLNTKLSDMGINAATTLTVGGNTHNITQDMTLGDVQNLLAAGNVDFDIDDKGVITIDTKGNEISGTLLDVLGLDPSKNGSTITSTAHESHYDADGDTLLSDLGINNSYNYVAYDSEGKALTGNVNNVANKTIDELIADLRNAGLEVEFDDTTHQIVIKDGYIEGTLADALGMSKNTTSYTESATGNTTLEKLGATGNETLTIDGGAAKTYGKDTTLETVLNDIKAAGADVTFKDGNVTIQGVTLGGTLPALLGLDATTQGTSVTSGALTVVTDSSASGSDMDATIEHDISLSSKIGDILGTSSNYTLSVDGGTTTTYTKDTTLQTLKNQIEAAGGKFTINDDNTISIEDVTMSGTLVGALGFDSVEDGTRFSTVNPVYIPGATTVANGSTSLDELFGGASGISTFSAAPARMAAPAAAPRAGGYTLSIDGGTEISYANGVTLDDIFADIIAAGGSASIDADGYIVIDGVHLEGTLVDALGLVETSYGTTITSGNLEVTESMTSTSSSVLMGEKEGNLSWSSTVGSITGDDKSYLLGINGTTHSYDTDVTLTDIKNDIVAAGGNMTLNSDNTISITGVAIDGTLAAALGFDVTDYKTTISSNTPIYAKTEDVEADASTTFNDLGINTNLRDYAIYLPDGTVVKASSTTGSSGTATIGDWLNQINNALNTANGTSGKTYAKIEDGIISITGGGYVTGSLPTALGMLTEEVITGTTMVGTPISYIEYEPLKYITSIQNGEGESGKDITYTGSIGNATNQSGTAADAVTSDGLIGPEDEFVDLFGNITDATLDATLSELLTPGASDPLNNDARLPADSYTLKIGSYATKTFDSDTTTLRDVVDYIENLKVYDPTYDMAFDAYLSGNKLVLKTDMDISGTLADVIGLTKVKTEDEYYTYVAKNIQYTAVVEGASNGFNFSIVGDKVEYDKTGIGNKDGYEYTGNVISSSETVADSDGFITTPGNVTGGGSGTNTTVTIDPDGFIQTPDNVTGDGSNVSVDSDGFITNPDIHNPPAGGSSGGVTTETEYYYQGSTVTYGGTSGTGYAASTKISDIRSSAVGTRWYVMSDNYTGSTTGYIAQNALFRYIDIGANTTIQDVVDFFKGSSGVQSASYSTLTGEMSVTTENGYRFYCSGVPYSIPGNLPAEGIGQTTPSGTYKVAFGKSAGTAASTATLTTKLSDLGIFFSAGMGFSVTNNGTTTDLTFSSTDTISTVVNKLNSLGLEASFLNGALRVSSTSSDFQITKTVAQNNFVNKLFGGSLPSIQTNTTTIDPNAITESTTLGELGITSGTLSNSNGISLVGGSVPERTFTSDNTLGDVFSYLEAGGATVTLNTDGTVSITGNAELSGDLLGQLGITLTSSKKTAVISSLTLTYGEKNLALSDKLSTLGLSGSYTIGTNGTTVLANSTVSNLLAALNGLNTTITGRPDSGTIGGSSGNGNIQTYGGEYKNVSYDPTTGILEFTITGSGSAAYMPAGTLFSALDQVGRTMATDGSYDTTYQYRLTKPGTNVTTATTLKQIFGDTSTTTHTIEVNGQTGTFSSTDNMGKVINWLNANVGTASLSAGQFSLEYTPTGSTGLLPGNMQGDLGLWISQKSAKGYETETVYNGTLTKASGSTSGAQYVSDVDSFVSGETYLIKSVDDLNKLAELVNNGKDTTNVTFIMEQDIDMSSVDNFAGIRIFKGTFYGNGHAIRNLTQTIEVTTNSYNIRTSSVGGLFQTVIGATIQDLGLENVNMTVKFHAEDMNGYSFAPFIGHSSDSTITNCYVKGGTIDATDVKDGYSYGGGFIGSIDGAGNVISDSYSEDLVVNIATNFAAFAGVSYNATISNSYANNNSVIISDDSRLTASSIRNFIAYGYNTTISNCFTTSDGVDGFTDTKNTVTNCFAIEEWEDFCHVNDKVVIYSNGKNTEISYDDFINQSYMESLGFTTANGWDYSQGLPTFGNATVTSTPATKTYVSTLDDFVAGETYYISTAADLNKLASLVNSGKDTTDVSFILENDIDMSSVSNFAGIGDYPNTFKGKFYGNGHTISNLTSTVNSGDNVGLFGAIDGALIQDLGLKNVKLTGSGTTNSMGALAGRADNSTIKNVFVDEVTVTNGHKYIGGLIGETQNTNIESAYVTDASIEGDDFVGGLVGKVLNYDNTHGITNSYVNNTSVTGISIGGLVGGISGGFVNNSYVANTKIDGIRAGGLAGIIQDTSFDTVYIYNTTGTDPDFGVVTSSNNAGTFNNVIYSKESGTAFGDGSTVSGVTGLNMSAMQDQSVMQGYGFTASNGWAYQPNAIPTLGTVTTSTAPAAKTYVSTLDDFVAGNTYYISTAADLNKLAELVNSGKDTTNVTFIMEQDIDMSGVNWDGIGAYQSAPYIGVSVSNEFKGSFYGNGHTITNLSGSLFNFTKDAVIQDVGLVIDWDNTNYSNSQTSTNTGQKSAALVAVAKNTTIKNVYATGKVDSVNSMFGGLVTEMQGGSITSSYTDIDVSVYSDTYGGLVGKINGGATISKSYTTGDISLSVSGSTAFIGGLVGNISAYKTGDYAGNVTISDVYSTVNFNGGSVSANNAAIGGLVGFVEATNGNTYDPTITRAYFGGTISQMGNPQYTSVGAIVGAAMKYDSGSLGYAVDTSYLKNISNVVYLENGGINGTASDSSIGTSLSLNQLQNQSVMQGYGFTTANGWQYTAGLTPHFGNAIATTVGFDMTTSTTIGSLFGDSSSHTLTINQPGKAPVNLTFSSSDTVQTVIDKLAAEGIDAAVTGDHRFKVFDESRWTLSGEVATKLFGGSGNSVYTYTGSKVTYDETVTVPGNDDGYKYTGDKIQYSTSSSGFPSSYTKLVDIFGNEVIGKQIIYKDYSPSNCMNHHGSDHPTTVTIDANTTIDSLNLHSNAFVHFSYDPTNGEFIFTKTKFSDGCEGQVSGSFLSYLKSKYSSDVTSTTLGTSGGITQSQEKEVISLPDSMNTTTTTWHDLTTSTTMKDLFGNTSSHTLTIKAEDGSSKNLTFSYVDTVQTVIDKLAAEGIDASVTAEHKFSVFDEKRWTLSGDVATKLFGGSGNDVYTTSSSKITYEETVPGTSTSGGFVESPENIQGSTGSGSTGTGDGFINDPANVKAGGCFIASTVNRSELGAVHVSDVDDFVSGETYLISTVQDLLKLAELTNGTKDINNNGVLDAANTSNVTFILTNDIDMSGYEWLGIGKVLDETVDSNWENGCFKGKFYGKGHIISGLSGALFNATKDALIQDVGIENISFTTGYGNAGIGNRRSALIDTAANTTITNVYATGAVEGGTGFGGLVYYLSGASSALTNSYTDIDMTISRSSYGYSYGGLVSIVSNISQISNSFAAGDIILDGTVESCVGGLIGKLNIGATSQSLSLSNLYSVSNISGSLTGGSVGGIIGNISDNVSTNKISMGTIYYAGDLSATVSDSTGATAHVGAKGSIIGSIDDRFSVGNSPSNIFSLIIGVVYTGDVSAVGAATARDGVTRTGDVTLNGITKLSQSEITNQSKMESLGFTTGWKYTAGTTPYLGSMAVSSISPETTKTYVSSLSDSDDFVSGETYYIETADDLVKLAELTHNGANTENVSFILENDINMSGIDFEGIGTYDDAFRGNFYGNGHTISNLTMTSSDALDSFGFFNEIEGALIQDVALKNVTITGTSASAVGSLVGGATSSTIINSYVDGTNITALGAIGGLVGYAFDNTSITSSYVNDAVLIATFTGGASEMGGLVGSIDTSTISKSYVSNSNLLGEGSDIGGLVGIACEVDISDAYVAFTNVASNDSSVIGALAGSLNQSTLNRIYVSNSSAVNNADGTLGGAIAHDTGGSTYSNVVYCDNSLLAPADFTQAFGNGSTATGVITITDPDDICRESVMSAYGFTAANGWHYGATGYTIYGPTFGNSTGGSGTGSAGKVYVSTVDDFVAGETYYISTAADLQKLASLVKDGKDTTDVTFILEDNIDMTGQTWDSIGTYNSNPYTPGTSTAFKGKFYGNGHTITGLSKSLFDWTVGAKVQDVGLEDIKRGIGSAAGLIRYAEDTIIKNVYVTSDGTISGGEFGGLVYSMNGGSITSSYTDIDVDITDTSFSVYGGLVAYLGGGTNISKSYTTGDISINRFVSNGVLRAGGLVGSISAYTSDGNVNISDVYSTSNFSGTISGNMANVGGLIGMVTAGDSGLNDPVINRAYYSGTMTSLTTAPGNTALTSYIGAVIGGAMDTDGMAYNNPNTNFLKNITNVVYNKNAGASATASDPSAAGMTGLTLDEIQNQTTMQGYGFTTANGWVFNAGQTPNFGNMTGSAGSTTTKDATLDTTIAQLVNGYTSGTISISGGGSISLSGSDTLQDVIDKLNNSGIIASWNNGKIELESGKTVTLTENNGFISKLFGSNSVTLNAISPAAGDYTMDKVGASGSSSSTVTHDATLNTTLGQLTGYAAGTTLTLTMTGGITGSISFSLSDTIQDFIDELNNNGIMASWNNGTISLETDKQVNLYANGNWLQKLFGSSSISFSPVSSVSGSYTMEKVTSGTGTTTTTYTMDASTTIGDLFGDSNNHTFTVNGNDITLGPDDTVQDLIDALKGYGVTATINDGKMTIGSNGDSVLTVSGDLANKVLGKTGSGSVSVDYKTEQRTLSLSTTMSELFWDNDSHDFVINKTNGQVKISLSGNDTIQDLITKLQAQGIVATIDSSGKMTFKSNFKWSVSGDLGNKVTEGVMNLTVTPLYTFESEELEVYTGHQTVSEVLDAGGDLITGNRYHIATVDDLKALAEYVNNSGRDLLDIDFILDNDIDMTGVTDFVPIGTQSNYFTGNFYGNGHVISNLKITSTGNGAGLFGWVGDGTIRDLGLENVEISGKDRIGALAGYVGNATIENVYSSGKVTGTGNQVGGLIGDVNTSNLKNVYSTAEVEGNTNVGGLIGYLGNYSVIENSYATGDVHSSVQAGGLVGGIRYGGTIKNSYATGDVYGTQSLGGLVGLFEGIDGNYTYILDTVYSTGRVQGTSSTGALIGKLANGAKLTATNAIYNSDLEIAGIGSGSASGVTGLTYVDMQDAARMQGLGFTTAKGWKYISDKMTPVLNSVSVDNSNRVMSGDKTYVRGLTEFEAGDTYYIGTAEDLVRLAELVNAGEDTTGSVFILDGDIDMAGIDFAPIGDGLQSGAVFRGDFYGNGHEISNLTINNSTTYKTGLFGVLDGAHIQDVAIVNANVEGNGSNSSYVGILAGEVYDDATIDNVYVTGSVSNGWDVGGLVGANSGTITKSYSTATVSGDGSVGGLVGDNRAGAVIKQSYVTGNVLDGTNAGGFAGFNSGTIESSYATGRVNGSYQTGGFVGYNASTIKNSYATGFVDDGSKKGGFAGNNAGSITGAVYNQSTKLNAVGSGSSSGITGLELSQMWEQDRMEGLGFTADKGWLYTDNTTPFLNTNNTMVNGDKTYVRDAQSFDSGEVFYIGTAQDLVHLAELVKNGAVTTGVTFVLDNDIVMTGVDFDPIGTSSDAFKGVFMGNGHTISGLKTSLFGYVEEAIIRDVGLENVNSNYGAALVENIANGKTEITNVYAKGTVTGGSSTGGLVGYIDNSATGTIISDSYAEVNVTGSLSGGLVGVMNAGTIRNSYASGNVTNTGSYGGGLVGGINNATIENSFASGNVSTRSGTVGGLVGRVNNSTITGSYASGVVTGGKGFIASTAGSNTFSGNVYNNAAADTSGAATGISLDEIKRQSVMEDLGFTSDKGWVYYEDQTPQLRGKDTSKQYTVDASLDSILANLADNSISKDITVEINGTTHTQHFNDTDTVEDVMNWLNGISGVTAAFDETNSQLTVTTDDGEMNITGGLANTLFGGYTNRVYDKITQNTDSSHLMAAGGDAIITENTTVKQLLNSNNAASIGFIDEDGKVVMESFDPDQTLGEVIDYLNAHGFNASITNGVFTAVKEDGSKTDIIGAIGSALKGENGTTTTTPSGYVSDVLTSVTGEKATGTTQLSALGIDSGTISIQDKNGNIIQNVVINNTMTVNDAAALLANYGITMSITDGKVTVTTEGPLKLVDGSSNMVSQMQLDNWIENKSKLTNTSTVAEMGFAKGAALGVIINGKTTTISFNANDTLDDIITKLNAMGIEASVDADGKFTATSDNGFVLTDELGTYLTQNSVDGYVEFANGYKSDKPLESPGNSTILTEDSLVGDILGTGEGGILRLTLDENTVVDLQYNADDTMQDIMVDLAAYGIQTQIKNGVLTAVNLDRTFTFSGDIGKAISGNTPLYENIETGYISKDLSYETVETANMNSTMKELGILGGQIHILNSEGGIVTTLDVDESFTVSQIKSMLSPYGFNLTMDANGKVSMTSSEGYSVSDGTSNLADVMGLDNWNQTTEKLALDTTISEMGFKDGADLNLFLDGAVMNVLSFDADQTLQDVIFALSAYGIDATVDSNGKFSAVSKEHTFIMSSTLGSFLTKGTSGYVNDDTGYQTVETLEEEKPYTVNSSEQLGYEKLMSADSTLASLGYENGGSVIVNLDGDTYYTLSFLGTDTVQDVIYALSPYGITAEVDANGKFNAVSVDHSFTLTGNVGNFLASGGKYQNEVTGYESDPITFETEEKVSLDTKLSSLGITHGDFNIMKDGKVTGASINITDDTTVGQLFNAIKVYGMEGKIMTDTNGETYIQISADSNTYLADGTANIVSGLGLVEIRQGDFEGNVIYWEDDTDSGLITEDMLLSTLDKDGYIAQGSLIFETGTGDEAVQHIINITADETVGSLIKKFRDAGIDASLSNGVIKISSGLDGITFTGGTSGLVNTIGLDIENVDVYASSSSALTYEGDVHYSAANFANGDTLLDIVNATEGDMSIFVDGVKCTIHVDPTKTFADLFAQISSEVAARTGLNIKAGFLDKEGNIVVNPTDDKNTGIIAFEVDEGHELVVGASNDTTNFATIANLNKTGINQITGSRSLYRVNVNSLITESGLYRDGDITEGTFKIGDAEFTIDSTTTLASLIEDINHSQTAYATAYWDTLSGTMVIQSTLTGASLINIEAGTSNFTDIMGFTTVTDTGASALVTSSQTLGKNAVIRINGTTVTATSNVITSDVSRIKGLTINLKDVSEGETVTITVEQDDEAIFNAVSDTIDAYNAMMEALNKELSDKNTLGNEALLKLMRNNLKRLMTSSLSGAYIFKNLAAIGISTGEAQDSITLDVTNLIIDKDKFMNALDTDSDAVKSLLVGSEKNPGIFLQANNIVESSIKSTGYFSNMIDSLTRNIDRIQDKINKTNDEITKYRDRLERQFHNMELTISGLQNAYSAFLN